MEDNQNYCIICIDDIDFKEKNSVGFGIKCIQCKCYTYYCIECLLEHINYLHLDYNITYEQLLDYYLYRLYDDHVLQNNDIIENLKKIKESSKCSICRKKYD